MDNSRSNWSNSFIFIMASIGAAVGLGNIWKFPYMVGSYGGSAFVLVYLICIILVSLPLTIAEIVTGKMSQVNPYFAYQKLFNKFSNKQDFFNDTNNTNNANNANPKTKNLIKHTYKFSSKLVIVTALAYSSLYIVIGGWVFEYFISHSFSGFASIIANGNSADVFNNFIASPKRGILMNTIFICTAAIIIALGIEKGIGKANSIMVPGLFLILLFLLGFGIYYGNFPVALEYLFKFDLNAALNWEVFFAAMAQTFFSISLGSACLMLYGSHLSLRTEHLSRSVVSIVLADTMVSILASLVVFSFLFSVDNISLVAGPSLVFETLPVIFSKIPLAKLIAPLFCLLLIFAAVSSLLSMLEPQIGFLLERFPHIFKTRILAVIFVVIVNIIFSSLITFSLAGTFGSGMDLFQIIDFTLSGFMFPLNSLLNVIFFGFVLSWISKNYLTNQQIAENKNFLLNNLNLSEKSFIFFEFSIKYISPIAIVLIFLAGLGLI